MKDFIAVIDVDALDLVWETNRYDMPLAGLCRYRGQLCRFETDYDTETSSVFSLTLAEKAKWKMRQKLFEWCIGYHSTYRNRKRIAKFYIRRPKWFWSWVFRSYYATEEAKDRAAGLGIEWNPDNE